MMVFLFDGLEVFSSNCQNKFAIIMRMCLLNSSLMRSIEQSNDIFLGMCPTSRLHFLVLIFMYMYFQKQLSIV